MPTITGQNFIGNQRSGAGSVHLHSVDASTGETLPYTFVQATEAEVNAAVSAANSAFPAFRSLPASRRAEFLEAIADEIDALGDDFVAIVCRETALPAARIQASADAPAGKCACSPMCCAEATFMARASIRPCRTVSPCLAQTCASAASA